MLKWLFGRRSSEEIVAAAGEGDVAVPPSGSEVSALLKAAVANHNAGRLPLAAAGYQKVLAIEPDNFDALQLWGAIALQLARPQQAVELLSRAQAVDPDYSSVHFNLGNAWLALQRPEDAVAAYRRTIELEADNVGAHVNLANTLRRLGRPHEALQVFEALCKVKPELADAHIGRGVLLGELGRFAEAVAVFRAAVRIQPAAAEAFSNLGFALTELGQLEDALTACRQAVALNANSVDAHYNLGNVLNRTGKADQAAEAYRSALRLQPTHAGALNNLGSVLSAQGQWAQAAESFRLALAADSGSAAAHYNLGYAQTSLGQRQAALDSFARAIALQPEMAEARWAHAMAQIPLMLAFGETPEPFLAQFSTSLTALAAWFEEVPQRLASGHQAVAVHQPFYLAYSERNHRERLAAYGALCSRLMEAWVSKQAPAVAQRLQHDRIAVGIVSANIRVHSVWAAIIKGMLQTLDRQRIELHVFYVGTEEDEETRVARGLAAQFDQGPRSLEQWIGLVRDRQLDVLLYPEIGMDPLTTKLASLRLAPVQAVMWGHPQTSGLPTMDYFLSGADFEPADAADHYAEKLIALPHLGCSYPALKVDAVMPDLAELGIRASEPLLVCPGSPFKYAPEYDFLWVEIARRLGRCQIVFVVGAKLEGASAMLRERLQKTFAAADLRLEDHVVFIRWLSRPEFYGLLRHADVFLDSPGFSGFNTVMQGIEAGAPVVTLDGKFMRGRLGSGILRRMGMTELIAQTGQQYVDLAVKVASDASYRSALKTRIMADSSGLFDDKASMRGLEQFLVSVAGELRR